ncbi:hypothetical protein BGZ47_005657 [Haplosporangium gracile]|nr:hypothetical protein BGZ47_005657 [Haplosporangium gracile]
MSKSTQSEGSTDIVHEDNQPEVDFTEDEITRAKATSFYDLILYVFKKARGEDRLLPDYTMSFSFLNHREMAKHAYEDLEKSNKVSKDILVLLSGIINTLSPTAMGFTLSSTIKAMSLLPWLSQRMSRAEALLSELLLALCPGIEEDPYAEPNLLGLQLKVWELLSQSAKLTARDKEQKARRTGVDSCKRLSLAY